MVPKILTFAFLLLALTGLLVLASPAQAAPPHQETQPKQTATPQPDGSIIHEVLEGESFWSIADDYELTEAELLELNNLSQGAFLSPGDLLLVRVAFTPTLTLTPSLTPTPTVPTATRRPTRTATPSPMPSNTPLPSATPTPQPLIRLPDTATLMGGVLPVLAAVTGAAGIALVIAGLMLKRRR